MKKIILILSIIIFLISASFLQAQEISYYQNNLFNPFEKTVYQPGNNIHTSDRFYSLSAIKKITNTDSLVYDGISISSSNNDIFKRFLNDNLFQWEHKNITIHLNPLFNFGFGNESVEGKQTWTNKEGLFVDGTIGKNLYFYTDFMAGHSIFPAYINDFISDRRVVPGQGKVKSYGGSSYNYSQFSGYLSYNPGKWFNLQLGQGKNFIGDGYRSLFLSDNAYSYPYLKFTTEFNSIHYSIMWAELADMNKENDVFYRNTKYIAAHYLNMNIGKRLSIGLFESVVWAGVDTTGNRGFEFSYLTPLIFFRPVEYSIGSPDNITMGLNTKYVIGKQNVLYGQFVLGEFKQDEVFSGNKWWANKQGFQIGLKCFDLFGIPNLRFQTEYNQVRPYTYSHRETVTNYGHYFQELAHPLGANFRESVSFLSYKKNRWIFSAELMSAIKGMDYEDDVSYGGDIFKDNDLRANDYGNTIGQGLRTNLLFMEGSVSYMVNPRNNFNIALGGRYRKAKNEEELNETKMFWFAIRTSLKNLYYDF